MGKEGKSDRSNCATAACLDVIGDRWTLLIVRAYIFGGMREYGDFLKMPEGISTNVLADRLTWLADNEIFIKHPHPTNRTKFYYEMTDKGFDLIFVIMELARWSWKYVPGSFSPPKVKRQFKSDPKGFLRQWKQRARQDSADYLASAGGKES